MFTDVLGVGMALAAITAARGAGTSDRRTFGLYRAEVLAALANAVLLFGGRRAGWWSRPCAGSARPPAVPGLPLMLTAAAGLAANLVVFVLLLRAGREGEPQPARGLPRGRSPTRSGRSACCSPAP